MKISHIKIFSLLVSFVAVATVEAQVMPKDKTAEKIDLGLGVEQTEFLSTVSAQTISGEELQQTAAISLADALYGKLSGLNAFQKGNFVGDEGSGASFSIRGNQSFFENGNILILVDGYERPIDRLTVEEVESVTVLKDAGALAMLGHEAVNGAILVKTKRGVVGKTQVKVGYSHKFTFDPELVEMVDGYNYATALNKARANDGLTAMYSSQELDLFKSGGDPYFYPNVDWQSQVFRNMGSENRANLSVTGGDESIKYYSMLDYADSKGLYKGTNQPLWDSQLKLSKANIRSNIDVKLSPTTKMSVNVLGIFIETSRPGTNYANDASITGWANGTPASAYALKTADGSAWGGKEEFGSTNPVALIQDTGHTKTHQRQLWADAKITQDLGFWVDGLSAFASAGYDNASITEEYRTKEFRSGFDRYTGAIGDRDNIITETFGNVQDDLRYSDAVISQWRSANAALGLNYKTSFREDDNFAASATYNVRGEVRDGRSNTFYRVNWIGHFHYDLQDKYVADLTLAANGSNRSYPAKWGFSPVLSLGYIFRNDANAIMSYGKVRGSAGIQHTDYVPVAGLWLANWNSSAGSFINGTGYNAAWGGSIRNFATTDFKQERAIKFDLGTDLRLWNALDVTADVYFQKRDHIMLPAAFVNSYVVGIQSAWSDVGKVNSYGAELSLKYSKRINDDLRINASAMVNWSRNEVTEFIGEPPYPGVNQVGARVNEAWTLEAIGFFKDQEDIDNSPVHAFSQVRPGDIKYKDQDGDGVVNEMDYMNSGDSIDLPELNYSFSLGAEYKGIGLNAVFQGTGNYVQNLRWVNNVWNVMADNRNLSVEYLNHSWDVMGDDALYPRLSSLVSENNDQQSSIWMKKTRFLKLRTAELYYRFPNSLVDGLGLRDVKIYVQGQNLLSIDNVDAGDAELLSYINTYPSFKSVNVGLSLTF